MRGIIFANGIIKAWPQTLKIQQQKDLIIAADGGTKNCLHYQLIPDIIIGDLDSIDPKTLKQLKQKGVEIHAYPPKKDFTDFELALKYAAEKQVEKIIILGALGARWDMSIANIIILTAPFLQNIPVTLMENKMEMSCLGKNGHLEIDGQPGDLLSLIPLSPQVTGISLKGLAYPLNRETLRLGQTRGISNCFIDKRALIQIENGRLLVVLTRIPKNNTVNTKCHNS